MMGVYNSVDGNPRKQHGKSPGKHTIMSNYNDQKIKVQVEERHRAYQKS